MMETDIYEVVKSRHSVRSYLDKPIPAEIVAKLQALVDESNREGNLHLQLVTDEPDAFGKSLMAHYGKFSNVSNYLCLVGRKEDKPEQRLGYYGEKFVILAQKLGLNTCWVGLTFSKGNTRCTLDRGEKIYGLIAVGYGATQGVASRTKRPDQICGDIDDMPQWFRRGVEFALLAPSAINQRKYRFSLVGDDTVKASTLWGPYTQMDLGIARYHFELGADRPIIWAK